MREMRRVKEIEGKDGWKGEENEFIRKSEKVS